MLLVVPASATLSFSIRSLIARDMALLLATNEVDIRDDAAVQEALLSGGFGARSVDDLRLCAVAISSNFNVISLETH